MSSVYVRCGLGVVLFLAAACPDDSPTPHSAAMGGAAGAAGRSSGSVKLGSHAGSAAPAADEDGAGAWPDDDAPSAAAGRRAGAAGRSASDADGGASGRSSLPGGGGAGKSASQGSSGRAGASASGRAGASASDSGRAGSAATDSGHTGAPAADSDVGAELSGSSTLDAIETNAQAEAVCDVLRSKIRIADFDTITQGSCTLQGLVGELQGQGVCSALVEECLAEDPGTSEDKPCTPADFPHCDNVTIDEYVACSVAAVSASADYFGGFTCETDPSTIGDMPTPAACVGPYEKCPELGGSSDTDTSTN